MISAELAVDTSEMSDGAGVPSLCMSLVQCGPRNVRPLPRRLAIVVRHVTTRLSSCGALPVPDPVTAAIVGAISLLVPSSVTVPNDREVVEG